MPSPVLPSEFKSEISDPTGTLCNNFINTLLKLPVSLYKLVNWMLDSSGNVSKEFLNQTQRTGTLVMSACLQTEDTMLLCDGREIDRTIYANLFAAIGTTYGTPSGGSVFKIPDFRAKFPVGIGTFAGGSSAALGVSGGEDKHLLTTAELPAHTHPFTVIAQAASDSGSGAIGGGTQNSANDGSYSGTTGSTGGATAHNTIPPYLPAYIYIFV